MPAFLVTGATGCQGGSVVRQLLAAQQRVHALVRDPSAPAAIALREAGAQIFVGTFEDLESLKAAAAGVSGVFVNPYPDPKDKTQEQRQAQTIIAAAKSAGTVDTVVVSTSYSAGRAQDIEDLGLGELSQGYYRSKFSIEQVVREAAFKHTVYLRPSWLHHNYLPPYQAFNSPELHDHIFSTACRPQVKTPHVDGADVGKFAAAAFLDPMTWNGKELELASEYFTAQEVANLFQKVFGREVKVKYRNEQEIAEAKEKVLAQKFQLLSNELWDRGLIAGTGGLEMHGIRMTSLEEYLRREKDAFDAMFAKGAEEKK